MTTGSRGLPARDDLRTRTVHRSWSTVLAVVLLALGTLGAIALVAATQAHAATTTRATQRIIVRPVNHGGHPAKGYTVRKEARSVSCTGASNGAIDDAIAFCGSSADYTVACWHASDASRVLCLPDPTKHTLQSIKLDGKFPKTSAPKHPSPQAVVLDNGQKFLVRDGGAAATLTQHPTWVDYYYRVTPNALHSISGPPHGDGINRRHAAWFVTTFDNPRANGTRHDVTRAYYVGTGA